MDVERDMGGVQRGVAVEERLDAAEAPSGEGHVAVPEEAVVHQQQRRAFGSLSRPSQPLDRLERRVDRRHDPAYPAPVLDLECVHRVRLVRHFPYAKEGIEKAHDLHQRGGRHPADSVGRSVPAAMESAAACTRAMSPAGMSFSSAGLGS
jgi:hypothetical protein